MCIVFHCQGNILYNRRHVFQESFNILNFSDEEKQNVYRLCAAIVHMGQMKFKQRGEQAEPEQAGKDG